VRPVLNVCLIRAVFDRVEVQRKRLKGKRLKCKRLGLCNKPNPKKVRAPSLLEGVGRRVLPPIDSWSVNTVKIAPSKHCCLSQVVHNSIKLGRSVTTSTALASSSHACNIPVSHAYEIHALVEYRITNSHKSVPLSVPRQPAVGGHDMETDGHDIETGGTEHTASNLSGFRSMVYSPPS